MTDLPPGRELDAHAARVVMEWHREMREVLEWWVDGDGYVRRMVDRWHPSEDTAAAFELVDKLKADGFCFDLSEPGPGIHATFEQPEERRFGCADGETRQHAITLAACKAAEARGDG